MACVGTDADLKLRTFLARQDNKATQKKISLAHLKAYNENYAVGGETVDASVKPESLQPIQVRPFKHL